MSEAKFKVGDSVIVTGDTMLTRHSIDAGSEAVILKIETDGASPEYLTSVQHTPEQALDMAAHDSDDLEFWGSVWIDCEVEWVREEDLLLNDQAEDPDVEDTVDVVNHPPHYTADPSGVECITVTRHRNFNIGNAMKYLWRAGLKDSDAHTEDLRKAIWYINDEINRLEGGDG